MVELKEKLIFHSKSNLAGLRLFPKDPSNIEKQKRVHKKTAQKDLSKRNLPEQPPLGGIPQNLLPADSPSPPERISLLKKNPHTPTTGHKLWLCAKQRLPRAKC